MTNKSPRPASQIISGTSGMFGASGSANKRITVMTNPGTTSSSCVLVVPKSWTELVDAITEKLKFSSPVSKVFSDTGVRIQMIEEIHSNMKLIALTSNQKLQLPDTKSPLKKQLVRAASTNNLNGKDFSPSKDSNSNNNNNNSSSYNSELKLPDKALGKTKQVYRPIVFHRGPSEPTLVPVERKPKIPQRQNTAQLYAVKPQVSKVPTTPKLKSPKPDGEHGSVESNTGALIPVEENTPLSAKNDSNDVQLADATVELLSETNANPPVLDFNATENSFSQLVNGMLPDSQLNGTTTQAEHKSPEDPVLKLEPEVSKKKVASSADEKQISLELDSKIAEKVRLMKAQQALKA